MPLKNPTSLNSRCWTTRGLLHTDSCVQSLIRSISKVQLEDEKVECIQCSKSPQLDLSTSCALYLDLWFANDTV